MSTVDVSVKKGPIGERFSAQAIAGPITLLMIVLLVLLGMYRLSPPAPLPGTAPATEFSAVRAKAYIEPYTQVAHPMGTPENAQARAYLLEQLKGLGVEAQVQEIAPLYSDLSQPDVSWGLDKVSNIVAKLNGSAPTKAILLVAHYDSVSTGPGASDGSAGVAALLEVLRALKADSQLRNDVIVLFTDGEEVDLLGAQAFIDFHPWAKDVGLVLNFVARGTGGPSVMFETGQDNGWMIDGFANSARRPVATSLSDAVYQLLPNDTDFTPFKSAGYAGLNFAYFDHLEHYHTQLDNLENLDERSLQQHGDYALALTHYFGNLDLTQVKQSNAIYFDLLSLMLVHYPRSWALPLSILVALVFVGVVVVGRRKKQLSLGGVGLGALAFLISLILPPVAVTLLWMGIRWVHPEYRVFPNGATYNSDIYMAGFIVMTIAIGAALYTGFRKKISIPNLTIGALLIWLVVMVASSIYLPSASYMFTWPLLFSLLAFAGTLALPNPETLSGRRLALLSLGTIPGIVLFIPTIYLTYLALSMNQSVFAIGMVALLLGTLIPQLSFIAQPNRWLLPGALALVTVGTIIAGSFTAGFDAKHPKPNSIFYAMDADVGKAFWVSTDNAPDAWTAQFFSSGWTKDKMLKLVPFNSLEFLTAPAPLVSLPAPEVVVDSNRITAGEQTVKLHIRTSRQSYWLLAYIQVDPATAIKATHNGKQIAINRDHGLFVISQFGPSMEGFELELTLERPQPIQVMAVDASRGLVNVPGLTVQPRPASMMPASFYNWDQDALFIYKTYAVSPPSN